MKIEIIDHAKVRMAERGASEAEVKEAVKDGTTVKAIYVEEEETLVVITVYVYYGEWEE